MKNQIFSSVLAPYLSDFIAFKRSLGYKYEEQERMLSNFDRFVLEQNQTIIGLSKEVADKWTERRNNEADLSRYGRIVCLCQLAVYLRNRGITSYLPQLPKYPDCTFIPYIYSYDEIAAIFNACDHLKLKKTDMSSSLFAMPCLLRMLYATGIRVAEALFLKNMDVNIYDKCLTLKETKNGKDRLVPFTDSLANVCKDYLQYRNKLPIVDLDNEDRPFFVTLNGASCKRDRVYQWFRKILDRAAIPFMGNKHGPRVHDIRHSFAYHSFVKLSDDGMDLYCSWPYLCTYLGHQSLESTEQYVRLTSQLYPELLRDSDKMYVDILPDITNQQNL